MKILITSAGSLVGQNILDALEGRREGVRVIGVDSLAEAASNFRCDICYMAPMASNEGGISHPVAGAPSTGGLPESFAVQATVL